MARKLLPAIRHFLFALLLSGLVAVPAGSRASSGDEAARRSSDVDVDVPGEVYQVRTLGSWREGDRAGTYRVVTLRGGFDRVQTVVMIQWMAQGLDQGVPGVVASRRVELLDDLGPVTVSAVRETAGPNGLDVAIRVTNVVSGERGDIEAAAGPPGQLMTKYIPTSKR